MADIYGLDAYAPAEVARRVLNVGVTKARLPVTQTLLLGVLAGAFIGLGALFFTLVKSDASLGFAASQVLGGVVFALGLTVVVVGGADVFPGNKRPATRRAPISRPSHPPKPPSSQSPSPASSQPAPPMHEADSDQVPAEHSTAPPHPRVPA